MGPPKDQDIAKTLASLRLAVRRPSRLGPSQNYKRTLLALLFSLFPFISGSFEKGERYCGKEGRELTPTRWSYRHTRGGRNGKKERKKERGNRRGAVRTWRGCVEHNLHVRPPPPWAGAPRHRLYDSTTARQHGFRKFVAVAFGNRGVQTALVSAMQP